MSLSQFLGFYENIKNNKLKSSDLLKKTDIWISSINAIVGQNNSGKSCLLRALNVFFNYEKRRAIILIWSAYFCN
ncbi:AAA family ATPase [Pseudoalteromonas sp. BSi20652]|uniref:AAA family ATPase n=1 Tax=Pseudoalteromonas sp. BSi20652 TaxID=388384 RepID=UPI001112092C